MFEPIEETCGFCGGSGLVPGIQHDAYGPRPDYPGQRSCEYCGGTGSCENGEMLVSAESKR